MLKTFYIMPDDEFDYSSLPEEFELEDHLGGFDVNFKNPILDNIHNFALAHNKTFTVYYHNILDSRVRLNYPNLTIKFSPRLQQKKNFAVFNGNTLRHKDKQFENFLCCFSGSEHISRQFLVCALYKFGWFDLSSCTKNFKTSIDQVDGNISSFFTDSTQERFYRKFLVPESEEFCLLEHGISYNRFAHRTNISTLYPIINKAFVQIVSETMATSSCVFVTEKVVYPILSKALFLTYGQTNYHAHLEEYYGFKKYNKIFDYSFDSIENPVIRLVTMLSMLAKFEKLSKLDWYDLYLLEQDTIDYNYNQYFSGGYLRELEKVK